jgi:hypothetical protein
LSIAQNPCGFDGCMMQSHTICVTLPVTAAWLSWLNTVPSGKSVGDDLRVFRYVGITQASPTPGEKDTCRRFFLSMLEWPKELTWARDQPT